MTVLEECTDEYPGYVGVLLVLALRTAADLAELAEGRETGLGVLARLTELRERGTDPLGPDQAYADRAALAASWTAEALRLEGRASVQAWLAAATHWHRGRRPHETAYCRWRAAEVASRGGELGVATRLLRAARRDAREHVPLLRAIDATQLPTPIEPRSG
jgi:hypothetical protein